MKIAKTNKFNMISDPKTNDNFRQIEQDLTQLFTFSQGRVRFGDFGDGNRGENISGEFQQFTSHASANTEFSVSHGLNVVPQGIIVIGKDKSGDLYQLSDTGTAWTSSTIYLKCSVSSVTFKVFLLK